MHADIRYKLSWSFPVKRSLFSETLLSKVASRRVATIDLRNFISLAEMLACRDHPICQPEHFPLERAGAINLRIKSQFFKPDLLYFIQYTLTVVFSRFLIQKVINLMLLL